MLHLTSGEAAAEAIRRTGVTGQIVPWRDPLHEGPVPSRRTLEGMSDIRARFMASCRWGLFPVLSAQLGARDSALRSARRAVLWFEHDLCNQLQQLQVLATLATQRETAAEIIAISTAATVAPFHGVETLNPLQLSRLWPSRRPCSAAQLRLAAAGWKAFTSPDPAALPAFLAGDLSALPSLRPALERFREEMPKPPTGISRTGRQILAAVAHGPLSYAELFKANQACEDVPFLTELTFRRRVEILQLARVPLLTPEPYELTATGRRVHAGELDARSVNGIDRWFGGIHLVG